MTVARFGNVHGSINNGGNLTAGATSVVVAFDASAFTPGALAAGDVMKVVLEPDTANEEVIYVNGALTAGNTTWASITRGQDNTTAVAHNNGTSWKHGPTISDYPGPTLFASTTLSSVSNSVGFTIPQFYNSVELVYLIGSDAAAGAQIHLNFNADTAANYYYEWVYSQNANVQSVDVAAQTYVYCGYASGAANQAGVGRIFIPNYRNTSFYKYALINLGYGEANGAARSTASEWASWHSTSAITSATFVPASGNFAIGSSFYFYGII